MKKEINKTKITNIKRNQAIQKKKEYERSFRRFLSELYSERGSAIQPCRGITGRVISPSYGREEVFTVFLCRLCAPRPSHYKAQGRGAKREGAIFLRGRLNKLKNRPARDSLPS